MTIQLYKSALCPRCAYASKVLKELQKEFDDLEVIRYDISTNFKAFKEANINMIPSLRCEESKRSWILPKKNEIRDFILENR